MNYSPTKFVKSVISQRTFLLNASVVTNNDKSPEADRRNTKSNTAPATYAVLLLYYLAMKKIA